MGDSAETLQIQLDMARSLFRGLLSTANELYESHCLNSGHRVGAMCPVCVSYHGARDTAQKFVEAPHGR